MNSVVYKIVNKVDGKFYIGSTCDANRRFAFHLKSLQKGNHHSVYLQRAFNKYGKDSFVFVIMVTCSKEKQFLIEQQLIDELRPFDNSIGYNMNCKVDSREGRPMSEEARKKMSVAKKGKPSPRKGIKASEETKRRSSESHKGQAHPYKGMTGVVSDKTKQKISESLKGRTGWNKGKSLPQLTRENNGMFGKKHSEESHRKMSIAAKNRPSNRKGIKLSDKTKKKMSESQKLHFALKKEEEHAISCGRY